MKPPSLSPLFLSAFAWCVTLGMSHILVPLYAYELGYSALAIGTILSAPVLAHFAFTLIGGAFTDRFGGRRMALAAYGASVLAGGLFALSQSYPGLLAGQTCLVISRALFWPAIWGLAMQLPGDRGGQTGRLNSVTNVGQIVGTGVAGLVVALAGFRSGFWVFAGAGLCALAAMLAFAHAAPQAQAARGIFAAYAAIVRRRTTYYAMLCAFMAGLPLSLSMSFYPILLVEHGYSSDATGWLIALRAAGAALVGAWVGRHVRGVAGAAHPGHGRARDRRVHRRRRVRRRFAAGRPVHDRRRHRLGPDDGLFPADRRRDERPGRARLGARAVRARLADLAFRDAGLDGGARRTRRPRGRGRGVRRRRARAGVGHVATACLGAARPAPVTRCTRSTAASP
ncbi:MAG: MFS transporter [Burkholderiales bacterium]|nr:MFS transporter [Burkholderiales bacterium]